MTTLPFSSYTNKTAPSISVQAPQVRIIRSILLAFKKQLSVDSVKNTVNLQVNFMNDRCFDNLNLLNKQTTQTIVP